MDKKYISLKEATKYCPYSQDYLKLRARQGKLKAVKMGRNWFTTKEWLEIYKGKIKKTSFRRRSPIKRLILFFLLIFLIFIVFLILFNLLETILQKIIPEKVIEIAKIV